MSKRFSCIIVDDEQPGRELIEAHLAQLPRFQLLASCADAIAASELLEEQPVDLMFLDIEMPAMKGTDFYQSLSRPPAVIFTTAYRDYAVRGFELEAVDYLVKPIVFPRFFEATQRFLARQERDASEQPAAPGAAGEDLFVRVDRKSIRLRRRDILFVQGMGDYLQVHTREKRHIVRSTMNAFADELGAEFLRIHRSYLVNRRHITAVTRQDVEVGSEELPISDAYREGVLAVLGVG